MTCQDCIHFDVCGYHITELTPMTVNECNHFKPKSRFVELPCEVGQTVYSIMGGFAEEMKVNRFLLILKPNEHHLLDYGKEFDDFGKTVFLSKEEAENALRERSK